MKEILEQFTFWSAVDIGIIAVLVYQGLLLLRGTKSAQMLIGVGLLLALGAFSRLLPFTTLHWLISKLYPSFLLIVIIIFQDDIRRLLSSMGKRPLSAGASYAANQSLLDEISRAAATLSSKRIGGLIVIERDIVLSRYVDVGISLDAKVTKEILLSIFHPTSPIHDGAVIVQRGRLASAGSFLPLTKDDAVDPNLGTRHRAALGISEETDALVVLISEEGASMSIVENGTISRFPDMKSLRSKLMQKLLSEKELEDLKGFRNKGQQKGMRAKVKVFLRSYSDFGRRK